MKIAVHIDTAERPFHGIDLAVLIAIQFLEMIMRQIQYLRMGDAGRGCGWTWIVALRIFENSKVHEVCSRLHDGFGDCFF